MNCFICKGELEDKETSYMAELNGSIIIIKNVPSQVCKQCGEISFSDNVAKMLEKIVSKFKNPATEFTEVNYEDYK